MNTFLSEHFLLKTETSKRLYHEFARDMPIIDYHCHLPPSLIADNHRFANMTDIWLRGDHYKWRAMRANGIDESLITGNASDHEKFFKWAETVPYTVRNPLYHWTHLELRRYFDIDKNLNADTAAEIYQACNEKLQSEDFRVHGLLSKMNLERVCTTDDPADALEFHLLIKKKYPELDIRPTFRPDQATAIHQPVNFKKYTEKLGMTANISISSFAEFIRALKSRHDFFHSIGCCVSDHGLEQFYEVSWTEKDLDQIFKKVFSGIKPEPLEYQKFQTGLLFHFASWDFEKKWVQQFHIGALRNNNTRLLSSLGSDTGWDSIGDFQHARSLSAFLDSLDQQNILARTIIYNSNPADNEMMAAMIGNFNDGSSIGKVQWGSAWWFLDQKDGMTNQLNALSNLGLISRFIGMITDSRSFLSYPRHEYFRRILCNLFGEDIENGELPNDINWMGKLIRDISYYNAKNFFNWGSK